MNIFRNEACLVNSVGDDEWPLNTMDVLRMSESRVSNPLKTHLLCMYPCMEVFDDLVTYYENKLAIRDYANDGVVGLAVRWHTSKLKKWCQLILGDPRSQDVVLKLLEGHWNKRVVEPKTTELKNADGETELICNDYLDLKTYTKDLGISTIKHEVGLAKVCESMIFKLRETSGGISTGPSIYKAKYDWDLSSNDLVSAHKLICENYELLLRGVRL